MDTLKLFMAIPGKVNFLQMGRYGEFSEQTYRNNFENETFEKPPRKPHTDHRLISVIFAYRHIINPHYSVKYLRNNILLVYFL